MLKLQLDFARAIIDAQVRLDWLNIEWSLRARAEARSISIHERLKPATITLVVGFSAVVRGREKSH